MYWHSWNEGICQTRFQELARTSAKPSHNPVQITQVVSLKQGSKGTTYYINSYRRVLDTACKSQIKSYHTPGHQLPLNCQVPWGPQDRSRWKHHLLGLPVANSKRHSQHAQGISQHPQTTGIRGSTKQWSQLVLQASQHPRSCKKKKKKFAKAETS